MKIIGNEKGMALVIVMMLALIGLMIVSSLLFMVTVGTRTSGYHGFFRSADDAGLGGAQLATEFVKNRGSLPGAGWTYAGVGASTPLCLQDKLTISRRIMGAGPTYAGTDWTNCITTTDGTRDELSLDGMITPDLTFTVPGPPGINYKVDAKIVDTVQGNSDVSGLLIGGNLTRGGVDNSNSGVVTPPQHPYLYRMEVVASEANTQTRTRYSVLYGF